MRHLGRILGFGVMAAMLLGSLAPSDVSAQKKKDKDKTKSYPAATDDDYKSIQKQKELFGTLVAIDTGTVTLRVEYSHYEPNPKYRPPKNGTNLANQITKTYNDLQNQMNKLAAARIPQQANQIQNRINQDMAKLQQQYTQFQAQAAKASLDPNNQPFITVTNTKDFDLEIEEKVVYRKMVLPFEYDDTGNVKTYTKEEKEALRGEDKTKPGYTAKLEELAPGQEVKLSLTPPKKKDKDADKDKDDKDAKAPDEVLRPTVKMVVMTKDNPMSNISPGDDTKKKKKKDN